ncbi:FAD-dependent monooxygenase [uncultured Cohaesibacter sp.]|uniref:FAD-dependent monooxygenase n=1 Tax=uncultured Cohaesibacter sp. TaxID=1002546 RepID=UPI0029C84BF5|nr:FAD-dependent monooxygenase [uncultured Cohaesibacter sp.]
MSQIRKVDVAVVGSGPAGHVAAVQMARLGLSCVLIGPEHGGKDGRTTALLGSSVPYLEALGLWDAIASKGQALRVMRLIDDTGRLFKAPTTEFDSSEIGLEAFGYNIDNNQLVACLHEAVRDLVEDERLFEDKQLARSVRLEGDHADVEMEDGSIWQARLAIAADGRNSIVRQAAGIEMRKWSYPQTALVVNLHHKNEAHRNISTEFHTKTGPFTLVPFREGYSSSLVCVVTAEDAERLKSLCRLELALELERRAHSIYGAFDVISDPQTFPLAGMVAKQFHGPRAAFIAESAHAFPPIGAQGLNLSLRDIAALADIIREDGIKDPGSLEVLETYGRMRRSDVWSRTAGVHMLNMSLISALPFGQGARSAGLALANMVPSLRKLMMKAGLDAPGKIGWTSRVMNKKERGAQG